MRRVSGRGETMSEESPNGGVDRRNFLKSMAAGTAGVGMLAAASAAVGAPAGAAKAQEPDAAGAEKLIPRPGSDFMVDVIKTLGIDYIAANPGSSFRSLHESMVNYGGNSKPELITCLHEETSVAIAHGYAKAAGKPMAVMVHGTVGLQHSAMAIYNAWCDRVPIMMFAGNSLDATTRRPGTEWYHSVQDAAAMVRDYTKWDDTPMSLQHFAESSVRAYKIANTGPKGPVLVVADLDLQERPVEHQAALKIPPYSPSLPSQGDSGALREAARMLVAADAPVIIADRAARDQEGVRRLVNLAEALNAPVVDLGARMNFPNTHYLNHSDSRAQLVKNADLILLLEVADTWGQLNDVSDPFHEYQRLAKANVKTISLSFADVYQKSNYQDSQRFMAVDLAITGDVQSSLPELTDSVLAATDPARRAVMALRATRLKSDFEAAGRRVRAAAAVGWDASPVTTARLSAELFDAVKDEPWSLVVSDRINWARRMWPASEYHQMLGGSGGSGVGYSLPGAVGAALANKSRGLISVTMQPDGDALYQPGSLWTAAHHRIPLLMVMHNNRGYYQEVMHLQRMASLHGRRTDAALIGNEINHPAVDFARLAQSYGVWAEGPVTDPRALGAAIRRALAVVKSGAPALVDVICQPR